MTSRRIIHVDMDCFYAAVECRDRKELRGLPMAVGGSPHGRGVLTTASYEARKFGVRSAMASATAMRLCPKLIIVRPDFSKYKAASREVRAILERFTHRIEPLSLDEAYLDVTELVANSTARLTATEVAEEIRRQIRDELHITASAGVAPNKFLAKIASDMNKPDGIKVIKPLQIEEFMKTLPIEKIWGVGKVTAVKMHKQGIRTCLDLQKFTIAELTDKFGSWGVELYDFARGVDDRPVREERERKSLSVEETYAEDLLSLEACLAKLPELYDDWNERAVRAGIAERIRGISVKLKYYDFQSATHESAFKGYPKISDFRPLLVASFEKRSEAIRLIGIGVRLESMKTSSTSTPQLKFDV